MRRAQSSGRRPTRLDASAPGRAAHISVTIRLGDLERFRGRFAEAEALLDRALALTTPGDLCDGVPRRALALNALGILYKDTARYAAAADTYAAALDLITAHNGSDHASAAALWHNLAGLAYARERPEEAVALARRAVRVRERHLGPDHRLVALDLAVLGAALLEHGSLDEAERTFERAGRIFRRRHPADQYEVAVNLGHLAACRVAHADPAGAEQRYRQALAIKELLLGPNHPEVARQRNNLAVTIALQQRPDEAHTIQAHALETLLRTLPPADPLVAGCRANVPRTAGRRWLGGRLAPAGRSQRSSDGATPATGRRSAPSRWTSWRSSRISSAPLDQRSARPRSAELGVRTWGA